jgi:branched-chain amino acid transport system substrate-binding protein
MNNRTMSIGAIAIVVIAAIFYFATQQKKVAEDIKVGILLGFTGPIESLTPDMASGAELAFNEASESGELLGGSKITILRADSTCVDSAAATTAAQGLLDQGMVALMGADCSGVTSAVATNVAVPNGFPMISPSATSPGLSTVEDNGLFFRTAPSDARGGQILADITKEKGIKSVAITYVNSDYGLGLADVYKASVEAHGITVTTMESHESDRADYSADVGVLSSAGGDALAVLGYLDNAGGHIIEGSLDSGAFDTFVLSDGMIGDALTERFGNDLNNSFGSMPGSLGEGAQIFKTVAEAGGINPSVYVGESYDAAALIVLAMQAGGSSNKGSIADNVMSVANAPGEKIYAGELAKGLKLLADGKTVDYQGATDVTFTSVGEAEGAFIEKGISGGSWVDVAQR